MSQPANTFHFGGKPIKPDSRDLSYLRTFKPKLGSTEPIPDEISADAGFPIPDQNKPNPVFGIPAQPYGCTNYTTCSVCSDEDGVQYNPGFQESLTGANARGGYDIRDSLLTAVNTGVQALGERSEEAGKHKRAAVFRVGRYPDFFDGIRTVIAHSKRPVSVGTPWFPEWSRYVVKGAIAPDFLFDGNPNHYGWHDWEISKATRYDTQGKLIRDGEVFLVGKTWQGEEPYDRGLMYFDRATINKIFEILWCGIFTVAKEFDGEVETVGEKYIFSRNLGYGMFDMDVEALQLSLISLGYSIPDGPTTYFGPETRAALEKFQTDFGIRDDGTHFGPLTRQAMNILTNPAQSRVGATSLIDSITDAVARLISRVCGNG